MRLPSLLLPASLLTASLLAAPAMAQGHGQAPPGMPNVGAAIAPARAPRQAAGRVRVPSAPPKGRATSGRLGRRNAAPERSFSERAELARRAVEAHLRPWVPGNQRLEVRTGVIAPDSRGNPVTGEGLVTVFTEQRLTGRPSRMQRLRHFFNRHRRQRFIVNVEPSGNAEILSFRSEAPQYRALRAVDAVVPMRELLSDLAASRGAREGAFTAAIGVAASATAPVLAVAALTRALHVTAEGVQRRNAARLQALDATVTWAKSQGRRTAGYPTLGDAYSHYTTALERIKPGTRPVTIDRFADQFRGQW